MATQDQLDSLRRMINDVDAADYPDSDLGPRIDAQPDLELLASIIWGEKASRYAELTDVQEGNSTRKMSQLYKQALEMATAYRNASNTEDTGITPRVSRTRAIERV